MKDEAIGRVKGSAYHGTQCSHVSIIRWEKLH